MRKADYIELAEALEKLGYEIMRMDSSSGIAQMGRPIQTCTLIIQKEEAAKTSSLE